MLIPSKTTNFRLSELKEFADYHCELDENGREFSKRVENTVGKGEIARYEQYLLFILCFQKIIIYIMSINSLLLNLVTSLPEGKCKVDNNKNIRKQQCNIVSKNRIDFERIKNM